jgi:hypothetical protein
MQHISTVSKVKTEKKQPAKLQRLLSLYIDPPQQELTLDEFEVISLDRLQLLRAIEVLKTKGLSESESSFNNQVYEVGNTYLSTVMSRRYDDRFSAHYFLSSRKSSCTPTTSSLTA